MSFPETFYTIDILFTILVFFVTLNGLRRGFSGELASVLSLLAMLAGLFFYYPELMQMAFQVWGAISPHVIQGAIFVVLSLISFLLYVLLKAVLGKVMENSAGKTADKFLGSAFGMVRGVVAGLVVMAGVSLIPNATVYEHLSQKSSVGGWVCYHFTPWLYPRLMELPVFDQEEN